MLLMPIAPSEAVTRATTHLVTFLETPPLVKVPTRGIPMQNTSILLIFAIIAELFRCLWGGINRLTDPAYPFHILKLHREGRQGKASIVGSFAIRHSPCFLSASSIGIMEPARKPVRIGFLVPPGNPTVE